MPIDFPANPTNGMVYGAYVYDSSITAWRNLNTDAGATQLATSVGLRNIVPTSIAKGASGSATVNSNGTVSFTATESISLNGAFSGAYNTYRIIINANSSVDTTSRIRYRSGGTDRTTATYNQGGREERQNGVGANFSQPNATEILLVSLAPSLGYVPSVSFDVYYPADATRGTGCISHANGVISGVGVAMQAMSATYTTTNSNDGFTFYPSTGTMTGTIQVFGYNK